MDNEIAKVKEIDQATEIIPLHFNVPGHHLPLDQFIETARSTQAIVDNFNKEFFDGKLKYQILVIPPKEGTFLEILGVVISVGAPIWAFLSTDIGRAYIKGLTGHDPVYWAEKAGEKTKEYLVDENGGLGKTIDDKDKPKKSPEVTQEEKKAISIIVVQITLGFLQKEPDELRKIGISKDKYRAAYSARNRIYQSCIDNSEVQGLGFDTTPNFPIKRSEFPKYIIEVPAEQEIEDNAVWKVETKDIKVNSPNWKREGRKWQAETNADKEVWFSIEDDAFWHHVRIKDIQPDINDNMKVQWAYPGDSSKPSNVKVLKVLTYNGKKISDPLSNEELEKLLQEYAVHESDQKDLFD